MDNNLNDNNLNDTLNSLRENSNSNGNTYNINYYYNYRASLSQNYNFLINDRIIALWDRGRHRLYTGWYYGRIIGINQNNNYRVVFEDGFTDNNVPEANIRLISRNNNTRNVNDSANNTSSDNTRNVNDPVESPNIQTPIETQNISRPFYPSINSNTSSIYSPLFRRSSTLVNNYSNRTSIDNPLNINSNISDQTESENILNQNNTNNSIENDLIDEENNLSPIFETSLNNITEQLEDTINQIYRNISSNSEINNNFQAILEISRDRNNNSGVTLSQLNMASNLISINPNNIHIYEQDRCSICNDDFVINEVLRKLNICPHFFHYNCIDTWFIDNSTCPICRGNINNYLPSSIENDTDELQEDVEYYDNDLADSDYYLDNDN